MAEADSGPRSYKVITANFRDRAYPGGFLVFNEAGNEMELHQWTGRRKKKEESVLARFRVEPTASVLVDGALLRVSELSINFESASAAQEIAEMLRRPAKERETMMLLSEGESMVREFLQTREEAIAFLSAMKTDPRKALVGAESFWPPDDTREPLEAVHSGYSGRLAVALEKMNTSLGETEKHLGGRVARRLYALAYTMGTVQNAIFREDQDLVQEIAALSEFGVTLSVHELRSGVTAEKMMRLAHPSLVEVALPSRAA